MQSIEKFKIISLPFSFLLSSLFLFIGRLQKTYIWKMILTAPTDFEISGGPV